MGSEFTFQRFWDLVTRHIRLFVLVGAGAVVLSAILSQPAFIKPRYRSTATVYPVNLISYSIETRTDQLLQLLASNSIRDSLLKRFDLMEVYELDTTKVGGYYALYNEFLDRVEISKTKYESVMIEVVDEDPVRARDMVNEMLEQVNLLARALQREKSTEILRIAKRAMDHERQKMDSVEARLDIMRKSSGLLSYDTQVKELTKGYVRLLGSGGSAAQREQVGAMIKELESKGGEFRQLTEMGNMFRSNYDRMLSHYESTVNDVTKELTYTNVIVYPEVSDKKVYPVRWLIVLMTTAGALLLAFLLVLWRDQRS